MPRFFFNVVRNAGAVQDPVGKEFPDVAEAHREARILAAELLTELIRLEHESSSVVILIVDENGIQQGGVQASASIANL